MFVRLKKSLLFFVLCASLVSAAAPVSQSAEQWRRLTGPEGASVKALFSHGDYLFAGTSNGVFRSTDQGQSWKSVNLGGVGPLPSITDFTAFGETIFAGSDDGHGSLSTDNGLTWKWVNTLAEMTAGFPTNIPGNIIPFAAIGKSLLLGLKCSSQAPHPCIVVCSTDNGKTWTQSAKDIPNTSTHSFAVLGEELFMGVGEDGGVGVFRSSDLGNTWTKIEASIATPDGVKGDIAFNAFAVMGKQLFARTNYGVLVSTDQGMNWRQINRGLPSPPKDGRKYFNALVVSGDTLFAGFAGQSNYGVFRFDSKNQSWTEVNNGLFNLNVNTFAVSGDKLFVGTEAGVWVSTNNGERWRSANSGINGHDIDKMAVRDNRLLVQASGGVYASADNGNTWTPVKDSIEPAASQIPQEWERGTLNKQVNRLAVINDVVIAGTGGGVFRSIDRGQTWEEANQGLPHGEDGSLAPSIESLAVIDGKIYAGVGYNGLFFSDDLGLSWTEASRDLRDQTVIGLVRKGKKLFAATSEDGMFVSLDQGRHWRTTGEFFSEKEIFSLARAGDHLLALTTDGIYLSTDEGLSWMASKTGFADWYTSSLVVSGAKIFAGTSNGLLVSSDQGQSWTKLSVTKESVHIYALAVSGSRLFAGTDRGVFLSTDDGRSWTQLGENFRFLQGALSLAVSGTNILAGCDSGYIYLSPDLGQSWTMVNAGKDPKYVALRTIVLNVSVAGAPHLIAGRYDGLFVSTNRGQTWRPTGVTSQISSLSVIGSAIFAGGDGGVFISKDNGLSWTSSNAGLEKNHTVSAFAAKGDRIYLAQRGGVYVSIDGGRSWAPINDGLTDLDVLGLAVNDTHLFVRTSNSWLFARRL